MIISKIISITRNGVKLLRNYKEFGFKPVTWFQYTKLFCKKGISAREYLNYKYLLKNKDFKESFLSYGEAEKYWLVLNPNKYAAIARDKYLSHLTLEKANIPMPMLYAYYNSEANHDYRSICKQLKERDVQQCVVKPAGDSAHGEGVFVCRSILYDEQDCFLEKSNGEKISLKQLLDNSKYTPLLFEERITQTEQISKINPSSVNTVRFMTALYPNKEVKVIATFMKIGRKGSDVDNAGGGGNVDCAIDVNSGSCYNTLQFNSFADIKHVKNHPDTNTTIEGLIIDNWSNIVEQVKGYQSRIPYLKMIGWDVALTDEGPVIIEINNWWDTTGQLFIGHGWRNEVMDCFNVWNKYYKNKKK